MAKSLCEIWRVQNEDGNGPYIGRGNIHGIIQDLSTHPEYHSKERCPGPGRDIILSRIYPDAVRIHGMANLRSGFADIQQYQEWFFPHKFQNALEENGFFLSRYVVEKENVFFGDKQVIFPKDGIKITGFRRCAPSDRDLSIHTMKQHEPIVQFMNQTQIPIELTH